MKNFASIIFVVLVSCLTIFSCRQTPQRDTTALPVISASNADYAKRPFPDWAKNASIYEVNVRQYTPEGTFKAFATHLHRLKEMGVDILWFMPIHPISRAKRKGTLGSYYAVADYKAVNPNFGSPEEFKALVDTIHELGMHVILDWVPNHTGWDNHWIKEHPDWYTQDKEGHIVDPINPQTGKSWGWTDVADLNYDNAAMRRAMIDALKFWITNFHVDGYRCDVAHGVPLDFWEQAVDSLNKIKVVFMLAESEKPALRNSACFIADYGWTFLHLMNSIAEGSKDATDLDEYLTKDASRYNRGFHMNFTTNHDENSWSGTVFERLGEGQLTFAALAFTLGGMPLIYSGQEAGLNKRLAFFEKDTIEWGNFKYANFYKTLLDLKHRNKALWNGKFGGKVERIPTGNDKNVFAFQREKDGDKVVVILNLSDYPQDAKLKGDLHMGKYNNVFAQGTTILTEDMMMNLNPWDYLVLSNK